jgi:hypothetical protein
VSEQTLGGVSANQGRLVLVQLRLHRGHHCGRFRVGGWVTGGAATRMASDAAAGARAELAAIVCVAGFNQGPEAVTQLAELKKASSYQREDMLVKSGWLTLPDSGDVCRARRQGRHRREDAERDESGAPVSRRERTASAPGR